MEIPTETHKTMVRVLRAMLEYRGDDAARLLLENNGGSDDSQDQLQREEAFVDGFAGSSNRRGPNLSSTMASYVGDVCALAVNNRVASGRVVRGRGVGGQSRGRLGRGFATGLSLRRDRRAHVSQRKLHAGVARKRRGRMSAYMNGLLTGLRNEESRQNCVFSVVLGYSAFILV